VERDTSPMTLETAPVRTGEILEYFLRHPAAADTLEGVARWRLLEEVIYRRVEEIREAVGWLVVRGLLLRDAAPGAGPLFRLNAQRTTEARQLLVAARESQRRRDGHA
jgi:hypothetical protein